MGYSGAGGKLIHKKNQKQEISWHCPFKVTVVSDHIKGVREAATSTFNDTLECQPVFPILISFWRGICDNKNNIYLCTVSYILF